MNEQELVERLTIVEQSVKSAHHRIDAVEKLTEAVNNTVIELKYLRNEFTDMKEYIESKKNTPSYYLKKFVEAVIACGAGYILALILK